MVWALPCLISMDSESFAVNLNAHDCLAPRVNAGVDSFAAAGWPFHIPDVGDQACGRVHKFLSGHMTGPLVACLSRKTLRASHVQTSDFSERHFPKSGLISASIPILAHVPRAPVAFRNSFCKPSGIHHGNGWIKRLPSNWAEGIGTGSAFHPSAHRPAPVRALSTQTPSRSNAWFFCRLFDCSKAVRRCISVRGCMTIQICGFEPLQIGNIKHSEGYFRLRHCRFSIHAVRPALLKAITFSFLRKYISAHGNTLVHHRSEPECRIPIQQQHQFHAL